MEALKLRTTVIGISKIFHQKVTRMVKW